MTAYQEYVKRLTVWSDIQDHMTFLYETVCRIDHPLVIELGVRSGNSTAALLSGVEARGGHLWSCDVQPPTVPQSWYHSRSWSFIHGDSISPQVCAHMPVSVDVVFIDTSHDYDQTLRELVLYTPRVRAGGAILLHDTQWKPPNVSLPSPGGPVTRALNRFCQDNHLEWHNRTSGPGYYGMGVINV